MNRERERELMQFFGGTFNTITLSFFVSFKGMRISRMYVAKQGIKRDNITGRTQIREFTMRMRVPKQHTIQ